MKFTNTVVIFTLISNCIFSSLITPPKENNLEDSIDKNGKFRILLNSGNIYNQSESFTNILQVNLYFYLIISNNPEL